MRVSLFKLLLFIPPRRLPPYLIYDTAALHIASLYFTLFRLCIFGCCLRPWEDYVSRILAGFHILWVSSWLFSYLNYFWFALFPLYFFAVFFPIVCMHTGCSFRRGFFFNTCIRTASLLFYVLICSLPFLMWEVRPVLWRKNSNFECVGAESWGQYLDHGNKKLWVDGENYTIWSVTRFNLRIFLFEWLNQKLKAKKCNTLGTGEKIRVIFRPKTPETWIRLQRLPGRTCGLREHGNHSSNSGRSTDICLLRCCVVRLCDGLIARPVST